MTVDLRNACADLPAEASTSGSGCLTTLKGLAKPYLGIVPSAAEMADAEPVSQVGAAKVRV